jgi:hypothetical protein
MADETPSPQKDTTLPGGPSQSTQPDGESTVLDDAATSRAIDNIVAQESDELLAAQDNQQVPVVEPGRGFWRRLGGALSAPWRHKGARYTILLLLFGGVAAVIMVPTARYFVLNTYGATVRSSVLITDDVTHQPLKNVTVSIDNAHTKTGADGRAELQGLRLGPARLSVSQPGFGTVTRHITLGWGSNPLGTFALKAVGMRYTFMTRDYLTAKGIAGVQVSSGDATAVSDSTGKAVLTLPGTSEAEISADIIVNGYRQETVTATSTETVMPVSLVTTRRAVYVSKEHGTYDVYAIDIDGQNKQLLLAGTGLETTNISLAVSPDGTRAALVSTRDNQRDNTGALLASLTLIDTHNSDTVNISHAAQIRLLDWVGTRLVFDQTVAGTGSTVKHAVISYDYAVNSRLQLAIATRFNSILAAQNALYYAMPADPDNAAVQAGYYRIGLDGTNKQTVLEKDVWTAYRTDYNKLSLQTSDGWYISSVDSGNNILSGPPSMFSGRIYTENPVQSALSMWSDVQNGQGVLLVHNRQTGKDSIAQKQTGLTGPLRWLTGDTVVYRVVTGGETADYVVSALGGGVPHKVADVVNTYGFTAGQ